MKARNQWHASHAAGPVFAWMWAPRSMAAIAARNRAWRELSALLPVQGRCMNKAGEFHDECRRV